MKKIISIAGAALLLLALAGCGTLEEAGQARKECHELNGTFEMYPDGLTGASYVWHCDISDGAKK